MIFTAVTVLVLLLAFHIVCAVYLSRLKNAGTQERNFEASLVSFSVIVAAKNEAMHAESFVEGIKKLRYPTSSFEVLVLDDASTDDTYRLFSKAAKCSPNIRVLRIESKTIDGKKGVLEEGVRLAAYEHIVITDADCIPQPDWLAVISSRFQNGCDVCFGAAPYYQENSFLDRAACYEQLRNSHLVFSAAAAGYPYSAAARSMAYTKRVLQELGGYTAFAQTLSGDDDLLIQRAQTSGFKITPFLQNHGFVYSHAPETWREYFRQKSRHVSASAHYTAKSKLFLGAWHSFLLLPYLALPLAFIEPVFALLLPARMLIEAAAYRYSERIFGYRFSLLSQIVLPFVYDFLTVMHYFTSRFRKISWK